MTKSSLIHRHEKSPDLQDLGDRQLKASQFESENFSSDIVAGLDVAVQTLNPVLLHVENHQDSVDDQLDELYEVTVELQEAADDDFALEQAAMRSHILDVFQSETSHAEAASDGCRLRCPSDFGTSTDTTEPSTSVEGLNQSCKELCEDYAFQHDDGLTLAGKHFREVGSLSPFHDGIGDTLFSNPWV